MGESGRDAKLTSWYRPVLRLYGTLGRGRRDRCQGRGPARGQQHSNWGAIMPGSLMNTPIERAAHQTNLKAAAQAPRQRAADTASRRIRTFLKLRRPVRTSNRAGTQAQYCGGPARRPACLSTSFGR